MYITNAGDTLDGGKMSFMGQSSPETNVSSITFSGLDGNSDRVYAISYQWKNPLAGAVSLQFQPNGNSVPQGSSMEKLEFEILSGVLASASDATFSVANLTANQQNTSSQGVIFIAAQTAAADGSFIGRSVKGQGYSTDSVAIVGERRRHYKRSGFFNDTVTNITSITLATDSATAAIGAGSDFRIWKPL
jgi:hypothetical protein